MKSYPKALQNVSEKELLLLAQKELQLTFSDFNLDSIWYSSWVINGLRQAIAPLVANTLEHSDIPFDPQDLEHQALFYLTTFDPASITEEIIAESVRQQYLIILERLRSCASKDDLVYVFRGLKGRYSDLNVCNRLRLQWKAGTLFAIGEGKEIEVEFKKVEDQEKIELFTGTLHYIHQSRLRGDVFGFFFKGDDYPWAVETTESSVFSRQYKRDALLAFGFHPDKAVELTRYYTLPGSPMNSVSIIDSLVSKYYRQRGIQCLFTRVMPAYAKTKATTVSGGLNRVLCISGLGHTFVRREINGVECWEAVTKRWLAGNRSEAILKETHKNFALLPAVDVFMQIGKPTLPPIPEVTAEGKVIQFV